MRRPIRGLMAASLATASATFGLALAPPAGATSSFSLTRIAGSDRYQTASYIDTATYPSGESTALLADAIPGHQSDALAASGVEGNYGIGVLLTDNTNTVPSSALSALSSNKVSKIVVLGGTGAISQGQINQLTSAGYQVSEPYQGATRWQTMQMVDDSMGGAGTDSSGLATAILASGEDSHLVDALAAGGLAYLKHFPIILTNSTGPGLQPEAQQVISNLGIKHLIVVGGTASIPSSEYSPPPSGVTKVDVEAGSDRSNTSQLLADFAISNGWLSNTNLVLARGDDGADALAGAPFAGTHGWPTVVTNSKTDAGSAPAFATEHESTLAGTSYVLGGTGAVPASQASAVQTAGGGPAAATAPAGTFGTAAGTSPLVTAESGTTFSEGGQTYNYKSTDTYQIVTTAGTPPAASCTSDSYSDFIARLSNGDAVSGNYQPTATSTFCVNDIAPAAPSPVTATSNNPSAGVTVGWTVPTQAGTDGITAYTIYRAPAPAAPSSCPVAYTTAPGTSPQSAAPSGYTVLATPAAGTASTQSYDDTSATAGNSYCYAVASDSPAASGTQVGSAQPASPNQLQAANPTAVPGSGTGGSAATAPISASTSYSGTSLTTSSTLTVTFNEPMAVAQSWSLTLAQPCVVTSTTDPQDTCPYTASGSTDMANPVTLNPSNTSTSVTGDSVTFTLVSAPLTGPSPGTPSPQVATSDLEAVAESGITSVASSGGLPWNLPGSAPGPSNAFNRVFGGSNANLPAAPTISNVAAEGSTGPNPNKVSFTCNAPDPNETSGKSPQLNVYSRQGVLLATTPCTTGTAMIATPTAVSGQPSPFVFSSQTQYLFTQTDSNGPGTDQESQSASGTAGAQPPAPAMQSATVTSDTPAGLSITYDQPIACSTVDTDASDYSVSYSGATSGTEAAGFFTASCSGSTVTLTGKAGNKFATGYTLTITAQNGTDKDTVCTEPLPNNTNCEAVGDSTTATT